MKLTFWSFQSSESEENVDSQNGELSYKSKVTLSEFYHQLMHKRTALKGVLKFTLKQLQHVSV
jgi:hypothetical protein